MGDQTAALADSRSLEQLSARYAEGMIGVEEITFQVPQNVASGDDVPLQLGVVLGRKTVYSNTSSLPVR